MALGLFEVPTPLARHCFECWQLAEHRFLDGLRSGLFGDGLGSSLFRAGLARGILLILTLPSSSFARIFSCSLSISFSAP